MVRPAKSSTRYKRSIFGRLYSASTDLFLLMHVAKPQGFSFRPSGFEALIVHDTPNAHHFLNCFKFFALGFGLLSFQFDNAHLDHRVRFKGWAADVENVRRLNAAGSLKGHHFHFPIAFVAVRGVPSVRGRKCSANFVLAAWEGLCGLFVVMTR